MWVFFHYFFILHHTPCAQPASILSKSGTLRTGESPAKHLPRLTGQREENVFSHLISPGRGKTFPGKLGWHTGKSFKKKKSFPSKAHCKEQAILLLPFMMLPVNSLVSAPSSHAGFQHLNFLPGWEGKGAFPKALPAMPRVNSPLYQEPLLVLLALRMHNFMTWVETQQQWILNKDTWGFYFFPGRLKGLVHI